MPTKPAKKPPRTLSTGAKAIRRAIAKSDPTKEPPTVGKPVIIDPVAPAKAKLAGAKSRKSKDEVDR
jgi:hypothetical protein